MMSKRVPGAKKDKDQDSATTSRGTKRKSAEDEQGSEYLRRKHNFIKSTIRTDYQPDICKDYKETGFCGFGDSCKFLHDRTDYKLGWQLDQEYAKGQYKDEEDDKYLIKDSDDEEEDGIPLSCCICKESFKDPIVTKCRHFFCSNCADKDCTEKCFICEKPTSGIFKNASKIITEKLASREAPKSEEHDDDDSESSHLSERNEDETKSNLSDSDT